MLRTAERLKAPQTLWRDKTRPSRIPKLDPSISARGVEIGEPRPLGLRRRSRGREAPSPRCRAVDRVFSALNVINAKADAVLRDERLGPSLRDICTQNSASRAGTQRSRSPRGRWD